MCADAGAEGIVVRKADGEYKWNNKTTRDDTIYKVKPLLSAEFRIVDVQHERRVVNGTPEKLIQFTCEVDPGGDRFKVTPANFGVDLRIEMFAAYEQGMMGVKDYAPLSLTFREYTTKGKPFHIIESYLRDIM